MNANQQITISDIDELTLRMIEADFGKTKAGYLRIDDGFALAAILGGWPVGFIGLSWRELPPPLAGVLECFIDIIEVGAAHRRQGIAQKLLEAAEERARERGAYQIRAWSSDDKTEAIPMWKALGFGLAPGVEHHRDLEVHGFLVTKVL